MNGTNESEVFEDLLVKNTDKLCNILMLYLDGYGVVSCWRNYDFIYKSGIQNGFQPKETFFPFFHLQFFTSLQRWEEFRANYHFLLIG